MALLYRWDIEKNEKLLNERGISFEEIVFHIENGYLLAVIPGKGQYAHQKQFIVEVGGYAHIVPFIENTDEIFLKNNNSEQGNDKKIFTEVMQCEITN